MRMGFVAVANERPHPQNGCPEGNYSGHLESESFKHVRMFTHRLCRLCAPATVRSLHA